MPATGFNRDVWDGRKPAVDPAFGARTIGDLALIKTGCSVWSSERRRSWGDQGPLGGVVLHVRTERNLDTGYEERAFLVLDPYYTRPDLRFVVILESELNRDALEAPDLGHVRSLWRRLAEEIGKGKGMATPQQLELDHWQHVLAGVLSGGVL